MICPDEWEQKVFLEFARNTEECMWRVAEEINKMEEGSGLEGGNKMIGMARVGDLVKVLLLRGNREIQVRT